MDLDANPTSTIVAFQEGEEIQLEDGSTGIVYHQVKGGELAPSVQLNNGVCAYLCRNSGNSSQTIQEDSVPKPLDSNENIMVIPIALSTFPQALAVKDAKGHSMDMFTCNHKDCGKVYSTQHHLNVHKRTHTGEKPFACQSCTKVFNTLSALKIHTRVHTGKKPYPCPHKSCQKAFKASSDLQKHIRTHTGERPFKCPVEGCGKCFTTSDICKVHIRTHTGERPHKCPFPDCKKSFTNLTNMKNHLRTHTGEKPYECTVKDCGKRFSEHSSLYKHQLAHAVRKPYECKFCHKRYINMRTLTFHKKRMHHEYEGLSEDKSNKQNSPDQSLLHHNATTLADTVSKEQTNVVKASFNPSAVMVSVDTMASNFVVNPTPQLSVLSLPSDIQLMPSTDNSLMVTLPNTSLSHTATIPEDESLMYINKQNRTETKEPSLTSPSTSVVDSTKTALVSDVGSTNVWLNCSELSPEPKNAETSEQFSVGTLEIGGTEFLVQVVNNPNESLIQSTTTADVDIGRSSSMLKDANTYFVSSVTSSSDDADIQTPQSSTSLALTAMPSESNFISAGEVGIAMPPAEQIQESSKPLLFPAAKRRITVKLPRRGSKKSAT